MGAMISSPLLPPLPDDPAARLALIRARAKAVFGDPEKAWKWLNRPNRVLAQQTPLEMIRTDAGFESVFVLLGQIEHGVYS